MSVLHVNEDFICFYLLNLICLAQVDGFKNEDRINNPNIVEKYVNFKKIILF